MSTLQSIVNPKAIVAKIEDNVHWLGMAKGALQVYGLETPWVWAEKFAREWHPPSIDAFKRFLFYHDDSSAIVRNGLIMSIGGAVANHLATGWIGRIGRGAEKFGAGQVVGGLIHIGLLSMHEYGVGETIPTSSTSTNGVYST